MDIMDIANNETQQSKFIIKTKTKRKRWISEDSTISINEIKNIFNVIKHLESLPIKKYTQKNIYSIENTIKNTIENNINKKSKKYTKKQIS